MVVVVFPSCSLVCDLNCCVVVQFGKEVRSPEMFARLMRCMRLFYGRIKICNLCLEEICDERSEMLLEGICDERSEMHAICDERSETRDVICDERSKMRLLYGRIKKM